MIKPICTDEAVLSAPCRKATADDAQLAQDLLDTLAANEDTSCIAANQIGETVQMFAYLGDDEQAHIMCNPILKKALYPAKCVEECLSHLGQEVKVTRFAWIEVQFDEPNADGGLTKRKRRFEQWTAQCIQHMIDHCKGKLI